MEVAVAVGAPKIVYWLQVSSGELGQCRSYLRLRPLLFWSLFLVLCTLSRTKNCQLT